jgi:hypothetical protein
MIRSESNEYEELRVCHYPVMYHCWSESWLPLLTQAWAMRVKLRISRFQSWFKALASSTTRGCYSCVPTTRKTTLCVPKSRPSVASRLAESFMSCLSKQNLVAQQIRFPSPHIGERHTNSNSTVDIDE